MGLLYLHTTSISENHWCDKMIWNFLYTMTILFWSFQTVKDKLYDTLKLYKLASNNLVKWSCSVMSDSLWPHGLLPTRLSVHGIFQARGLEWVAISFSRRSSQPRDRTQGSNPGLPHCRQTLYHLSHQGRSNYFNAKYYRQCVLLLIRINYSLTYIIRNNLLSLPSVNYQNYHIEQLLTHL